MKPAAAWLVCYDIAEPRRLARVWRAVREFGVPLQYSVFWARLDGIGTVASRFTITPFVGFLAGLPVLTPNPREVVRTLEVRLSELLDPDAYREERWDTHTTDFGVHFYELDDETVWGATARILTGLLAHLTGTADLLGRTW